MDIIDQFYTLTTLLPLPFPIEKEGEVGHRVSLDAL